MPPQTFHEEFEEETCSFTAEGSDIAISDLPTILRDIANLIEEGYDSGIWGIGTGSWQITTEV